MEGTISNYHGGPHEKRIANASWMDPLEAAERFPHREGAFWIGRSPIDDDHAVGFDDDRHVLLVAGTRSGKGRAVIVNNLALWPGSIVSIDPKGENAMLTARRRGQGSEYCAGLGQDVFVLDPFNTTNLNRIDHSMRAFYNPLADMDANDPELPRYAARIAESMMFNLNKNDPSWDKKGGSMIEALIMHVKTSPDFEESERNLVTVRRLLMAGDRKAYETLKSMDVEDVPSAIELLWQAVIDNQACDGILSDIGHSFLHSCRTNTRYFDSVKTSAEDHTKWIDSQGMREVLSGSPNAYRTFSLDDLKNHPEGISVYLCLPQADMATYARWQRMMVDLLVAAMQKTQTRPRNGHRVLFSLDEFAGLGKMDRIRSAAAEIAGAGVKLFISVQGLNQLEEVYEKGWETFISNSGLQLYFDMKDNFTLDYIQKALGETEIVRTTYSTNFSTSNQTTQGTNESTSEGSQNSTTRGGHTGWNKSRSGGSSRNWGKNSGSSSGEGYGPHVFFQGFEKSTNSGSQSGRNSGGGRNSGWQKGKSGGQSWSDTQGTTHQTQYGRQSSETQGQTQGHGSNQSVHKKPLVTFDEANKLFSRIDNTGHLAYPGLALVRIAGQDPILVRRVNYDEDPAFVRCFDPHPDHPFIPYEAPKEIEPLKEEPELVIPNRQFSMSVISNVEIKANATRIMQTYHKYRYEANRIFPYKIADVWRMLTFSEVWHIWLEWVGSDMTLSGLPDIFGPGQEVKRKDSDQYSDQYASRISALIMDGINGSSLTFRWHGYSPDILFYTITLSSCSRTETKVLLEACYYHEDLPGGVGKVIGAMFRKANDEPDGHRQEYERRALKTLKQFEGECYDLFHFGHSIRAQEGRAYWETWLYESGQLNIHPDSHGNRILEIGTIFEAKDKIGYVYNPQLHESEQFAKEHYFIEAPRKCIVRDIVKNHGATVEKYDRFFLLEMID
jgi:type IV secretory pathway TraG/TraD family ATPase VirD4